MVLKHRPYKTYTREFKLEALRLMETSEKTAADVARELGLRRNQLYKWKEQMSKISKGDEPKRGRPKKENQSETARLLAENRRLKEENEILKRAAVFFAKELD